MKAPCKPGDIELEKLSSAGDRRKQIRRRPLCAQEGRADGDASRHNQRTGIAAGAVLLFWVLDN